MIYVLVFYTITVCVNIHTLHIITYCLPIFKIVNLSYRYVLFYVNAIKATSRHMLFGMPDYDKSYTHNNLYLGESINLASPWFVLNLHLPFSLEGQITQCTSAHTYNNLIIWLSLILTTKLFSPFIKKREKNSAQGLFLFLN